MTKQLTTINLQNTKGAKWSLYFFQFERIVSLKKTDLCVLNGHESDLNSYTENARQRALYLFKDYASYNESFSELKSGYSSGWVCDEPDKYHIYLNEKKKFYGCYKRFLSQLIAFLSRKD